MIIAHRSRIPQLLELVTTDAVLEMAMVARPDSEFRCEGNFVCIARSTALLQLQKMI